MECNLCGRNYPKLSKANIEGSIVEVCDDCLKFGIKIPEKISYTPFKKKIDFDLFDTEEEVLASGYGQLIKNAREAKKLQLKDFASKINEKESVIRRIEEELMKPNRRLVRKIENFLDVKLFEKYETEYKQKKSKKHGEITVGDVVDIT